MAPREGEGEPAGEPAHQRSGRRRSAPRRRARRAGDLLQAQVGVDRSGRRRRGASAPSASSAQARVSSARLTSRISSRRACSSGSSTGTSASTRRSRLRGIRSAEPMRTVGRPGPRRWRTGRCGCARGSGRRSSAPGCCSDRPGTPGMRQQMPRMMRSTSHAGGRRLVERVDHARRRRGCSSSG